LDIRGEEEKKILVISGNHVSKKAASKLLKIGTPLN